MKFNRGKLQASIEAMREPLFMSKSNQGHEAFRNLVHKKLNIEILGLSELRSSEEFDYRKGKIDSLKEILVLEEKLILMRRNEKQTKDKRKGSEKISSYIRSTGRARAGLAQ